MAANDTTYWAVMDHIEARLKTLMERAIEEDVTKEARIVALSQAAELENLRAMMRRLP